MLVSHGFTSFSVAVSFSFLFRGCVADLLTLDSGTPNSCHLVQLGASWAPLVSSGQVWRLVVPWVFRETSSEMGLELVEMVHVPYVFLSFFGEERRSSSKNHFLCCWDLGEWRVGVRDAKFIAGTRF